MATAASRRSISFARSRLALAAAVLLGAVALVAAIAFVLVDRGSEERDAVADYIEDANEAQQSLAVALGSINRSYAELDLDPRRSEAQARELAESTVAIERARARVAALEVPDDARELHRRLLRLLSLEAAFARDLTRLVEHLPALSAAGVSLAAATRDLARDLRATRTAEAQAAVFARFTGRLSSARATLADTRAPVLVRELQADELARLDRLTSLGRRIRAALLAGEARQLATLLDRLVAESGRGAGNDANTRFVRAYNRRLQAIREQEAAVRGERARLDRELS